MKNILDPYKQLDYQYSFGGKYTSEKNQHHIYYLIILLIYHKHLWSVIRMGPLI